MLNIWKGLKGGKGREIYGNYVIISKTFKRLKINMQEFLPFHISTFTTKLGKKISWHWNKNNTFINKYIHKMSHY